MSVTRNLFLFLIIAFITAACGGGSSALSNSDGVGSGNGSGGAAPITYGSATLQWSAPTTLADNTTVSSSDISGYRLYYGPSATYTPFVINVPGSTTTQYTVTLPSGSYYFRIAAVDTSGHPGLLSNALQKTL